MAEEFTLNFNMEGPYSCKFFSAPLPDTARHTIRTCFSFKMKMEPEIGAIATGIVPLSAVPKGQIGDVPIAHFVALHYVYAFSQCIGAKFNIRLMTEFIDPLDQTPVISEDNTPTAVWRSGLFSLEQFNLLQYENLIKIIDTAPHSHVRSLAPSNMSSQEFNGSVDLALWLASQKLPTVNQDLDPDPRDGGLSNTSYFDGDGDIQIRLSQAMCVPAIGLLYSGSTTRAVSSVTVQVTLDQDWVFAQLQPGRYPFYQPTASLQKQQIMGAKLSPVKPSVFDKKSLSLLDRLRAMFI